MVRTWQGRGDGHREGSALANAAAAKHHPRLPSLPSSERGRTGNSAQELLCSLFQKPSRVSPNTPLFALFCHFSVLWGVTVPDPLQSALKSNPPECTAHTTLLQGLQAVWPQEHGQGYQPAKTPLCQMFPPLHHTLCRFKASLTWEKCPIPRHYQQLITHSAGATLGWLAEQ